METLRHHLVHHRWHMLGCASGAVVSALGSGLDVKAIAVGGAVVCGAFCLDMVRVMVVRPRGS